MGSTIVLNFLYYAHKAKTVKPCLCFQITVRNTKKQTVLSSKSRESSPFTPVSKRIPQKLVFFLGLQALFGCVCFSVCSQPSPGKKCRKREKYLPFLSPLFSGQISFTDLYYQDSQTFLSLNGFCPTDAFQSCRGTQKAGGCAIFAFILQRRDERSPSGEKVIGFCIVTFISTHKKLFLSSLSTGVR